MALTTYTELQAAVADYLGRSDLTSPIVDAIRLTEATLNYGSEDPQFPCPPLRVRQMQSRMTKACTAGTAYVVLPNTSSSIYLEMIDVRITSTDPDQPLTFLTSQQMSEKYPYEKTGRPLFVSIVDSELRLAPTPDSAYTLEARVYVPIPALASNSTNWLLTAFPNVYLYGALFQTRMYMKDMGPETANWWRMFRGAVASLSGQDNRAKYAGAPLSMRAQWVY